MSKQSLIIAVKEAEYIDRLAEYIRHSPFGEIWQLTAFTNPAALKHFIRGGYRIDLIVAQPAMLEGLGESIGSIPTAALVSYHGQCQRHSRGDAISTAAAITAVFLGCLCSLWVNGLIMQ